MVLLVFVSSSFIEFLQMILLARIEMRFNWLRMKKIHFCAMCGFIYVLYACCVIFRDSFFIYIHEKGNTLRLINDIQWCTHIAWNTVNDKWIKRLSQHFQHCDVKLISQCISVTRCGYLWIGLKEQFRSFKKSIVDR